MGSIIKIVSKSRSIHNTISYMLNKQEDFELVTGIGVSDDLNAIEDFKRINEIFGDKGKIKLWHFTRSLDPLEDISAERTYELGVKWAEKVFPNQSILVITHTDKGHVHNHLGTSPNDRRTRRKVDIRKSDIQVLQAWSDNMLVDNGISPLDMHKYNHLVADHENWEERELRTENKISDREKIKLAVSKIAQYAKNYDDFHTELKKKHSVEAYRFAKNQRIGYRLLDSEGGLVLKIGGKRLEQNYYMNYLDGSLTENKKTGWVQSEEVSTGIAIRHLGKSLNGRADSRINWQERAQHFELDNENIPFLRSSEDYEGFYDKYRFEIEDRIEIVLDVFDENKDRFFGLAVEKEPLKYKGECIGLIYKKVVYDISESLSTDYDQFDAHDTRPILERNSKKRYIQETRCVPYLFNHAIDDGTIKKTRREYEETAGEIDYQKWQGQYDMDFWINGEREKMSYPCFRVSASEETKEIFNNSYNQNKGVFGSRANMFRAIVSNLPVLASPSNNKFNDLESIRFEQKISELESMISNEVVGKLDDINQKLSYFLKNKYKTGEEKDV